MAVRGENVGTAYVRILADGSGLDRSIRDQMDDVDFDSMGRKASAEWTEGFEEEQERKPNQTRLRDALAGPLIRGQWLSDEFFKSKNWKDFRSGLTKEFGDAGERAGEEYERRVYEGMDLGQLAERVRNVIPDVVAAQKQLDKEMEKADLEAEREQERHLKAWFGQMRKDLTAHNAALLKDRKDMDRDLEAHWASLADRAQKIAEDEFKARLDMDRDLERHWDDLAERERQAQERARLAGIAARAAAKKALEDAYKDRLDMDRDLEAHWRDLAESWNAIWDDAHDENQRRNEADFKHRLDLDKQLELHWEGLAAHARLQQEIINEAYRDNALFDRDRSGRLRKLREDMQLLTRETEQLAQGLRGAMPKKDLEDLLASINSRMSSLHVNNRLWTEVLKDTDTRLRDINPRLNVINAHIRSLSDGIGKAFGRGSRNDFINFMGVFARGFARLPLLVTGALDSITRSISRGTLGKDLLKVGASIASGVAGMFAFVGPIVSILSLAAGAVAALASSLAMGLMGALGAVAGAFVPVIAGIGTMVLAFQNAPASAKKSVDQIKEHFQGLGKVAAEEVFKDIDTQVDRLVGTLQDFEPVVRDIGIAIRNIGDYWLDAMEGPGFRKFQNAMGKFLPAAVETLGKALGDFLGGMGGVLRGLIPLTERFIGWMGVIAKDFNEWANSVKGQTAIRDFFDDAGNAAATLGGFLGAVNDLFWTLVRSGQSAGDSLFSSMTTALQKWNSALQADPTILQKWFDSAQRFGEAVGRVLVGIGKLFAVLDSTASRTAVVFFFDALANILGVLQGALKAVAGLFGESSTAVEAFAGKASAALIIAGPLTGKIQSMGAAATGLVGQFRSAETRMAALGSAARTAAGPAGILALVAASQTTNRELSILGTTAAGALLGFSVGGPVGAAIGGFVGLMGGVVKNVGEMNSSIAGSKEKVLTYAGTFDTLTGAVTQSTRAIALQKLQQDDVINQAAQFGVSARDLVSAVLGEEDAIKRVNTALNSKKDLLGGLTAGSILGNLASLRGEFGAEADAALEAAGAVLSWKEALDGIKDRQLRVEVKNIGMDMTLTELTKLNKKYDLTPKEIRTIVKATNMDLTNRELNALIKKLTETDGKKANPKVTLDNKTGPQFKELDSKIGLLDRKKPTPKVGLDASAANRGFADLFGKSDKLNAQKPTPKAGLDASAAHKGFSDLFAKSDKLDGMKPTPKANLEDKVSGIVGELTSKLNIFGRLEKSPKVTVNGTAALGTLGNIRFGLDSLRDKTVTVTTNYRTVGAPGAPRGVATGGHITGPGTWTSDSIPAMLSNNEYVIKAAAVSKYGVSFFDRLNNMVEAPGKIGTGYAGGGRVGGGKVVNVGGMTIVTPNADSRAVAAEVVDRIATSGY